MSAAQAERLLALAEEGRGDPGTIALMAQAHATLALVEEQRTANLIAAWVGGGGGNYNEPVATEVRRRLGLAEFAGTEEGR